MDITSNPNLKPFRLYSPWEEINGIFAADTATLNKGTFVTISKVVPNQNVFQSGAVLGLPTPISPLISITASNGNLAPSYAYSPRWEMNQRVRAAQSGEAVLGMTLRDVKENNAFNEPYVFRPGYESAENMVVPSGKSVPIISRGIFYLNGFSGVPNPTGSLNGAIYVSGGKLVCGAYVKGTSVGKWLSAPDADGYAIFKLEC